MFILVAWNDMFIAWFWTCGVSLVTELYRLAKL